MTDLTALRQYSTRRDAEAFALLVEQYQCMVLATCRRKLADAADVDDAVQETFLRLAQKAGEVQSNLGGWLHRCAVNVSLDLNRRQTSRQKHESAAAVGSPSAADDPQRTLAELREHLDAAMEKLPAEQRELIIQRYFVGRPQVDLAAEAGVTPSALSRRLEQAIDALRKHLAAMGCVAAAVGVVAFMESETKAAAVSKALTANLMKIGLSGTPAVPAVAWWWWTKFAAMIFAALAIVAATWMVIDRPTTTAQAPAAMPATQPVATPAPSLTVLPDSPDHPAQAIKWKPAAVNTEPAVLSGRVVDREGKPVADATVELNRADYGGAETTQTDDDGTYTFTSVKKAGEYRIGIKADGFISIEPYISQAPGVLLSNQSQVRRDWVLDRGVTLRVAIVDGDGHPVPDANVNASIPGDRASSTHTQKTDKAGHCTYQVPVSKSPYVVAAYKVGFGPSHQLVTASDSDKPIDVSVALPKGITVTGIAICNDGKPAKGWQIQAKPDWWVSGEEVGEVTIGTDGRFVMKDVAAGNNQLWLWKNNSGQSVGTQVMPPATQPWTVNLPMASPASLATLNGTVKFIGGDPVSVQISATGLSGDDDFHDGMIQPEMEDRATRKAGTHPFKITDLPPGVYRITFESSNIEPKTLEKVQVPGALLVVELKVISKPKLNGTVVDAATSKPIDHFAVRAKKVSTLGDGPNYSQDENWVQISDPQGKFAINLIGPGVYQVQASIDGYAWVMTDSITAENNKQATVQIKATAGGSMSGQIVDAAGKPVRGAKVIPLSMARGVSSGSWKARFETDAGAAVTGEDGRFTLPHLAAGSETIKIVHPDFAPSVIADLKIVAGQATDAGALKLLVGGAAEGIVYDEHGQPRAGQTLKFQDESAYNGDEKQGELASVVTDSSGHFRVDHLPSQPIYVNFDEMWSYQGVVRRTFRPIDGQTTPLDFGGTIPLTGRLVDRQGSPLKSVRLELAVSDPNFSEINVFATTDAQGKFTMLGAPVGRYTISYMPSMESREWVAVMPVEVTGRPIDLGDVVSNTGDVLVKLSADNPDDVKSIRYVSISTDRPGGGWQRNVAQAGLEGVNWRAKNVPAGKLRALVLTGQEDQLSVVVPFERMPKSAETPVEAHLPKSGAKLVLHITDPPAAGTYARISLHCESLNMNAYIGPAMPQPVSLPAGTYRVLSTYYGVPREDVPPIVLTDDQTTEATVSMTAPPTTRPTTVFVPLHIWTATGGLLPGAVAHLITADGTAVSSNENRSLGPTFTVPPGHYRVEVERPDQPPFTKDVDIAPLPNPGPGGAAAAEIDLFVP